MNVTDLYLVVLFVAVVFGQINSNEFWKYTIMIFSAKAIGGLVSGVHKSYKAAKEKNVKSGL